MKDFVKISLLQAFHGVVSDIIGIAAGKTKSSSMSSTATVESEKSEPEHLHVSV